MLCLLFSLSFANRLATIYASRLLQLHIYIYLALPISLNSLDREGAWFRSRRRVWAQVGVRRGTWSLLCFFSLWSVVEPSWDDRGSSIWGCLIFIWILTVVGLYVCILDDVWINLCIVWSGDCKPTLVIPFLFITWDCVKMTLLATTPQCGYASKSCLDTWEI